MTLKGAEQELLDEINRLGRENLRLRAVVAAVEELCNPRTATVSVTELRAALRGGSS